MWDRSAATILILAVMCAECATTAVASASPPEVFAHYYTWWDGNKPDYPLMPKRGWYRNQFDAGRPVQPPTIYAMHIAEARLAGLAGFCVEWPGVASPETRLIVDGLIPANNSLRTHQQMKYLLCFDSTIWAMAYLKIIKNWYDPIPFDEEVVQAFAEQMAFVAARLPELDPQFRRNYLHIDNRPAVFVYNAHGYRGEWTRAVELAREQCAGAGGIFLIGDFEVSPHRMFDQMRAKDYPEKAKCFDAVTNYTLLSGHTFVTMHEYILSGQLDSALANGKQLSRHTATGEYYPGIIAQYFKAKQRGLQDPPSGDGRLQLQDRTFITDGSAGYAPVCKAEDGDTPHDIEVKSARTVEYLVGATWRTRPRIVFVTSWNEPFEGTMIEPTRSANPAGYVMGTDFLDVIRDSSRPSARLADWDGDGDLDLDDRAFLRDPRLKPVGSRGR